MEQIPLKPRQVNGLAWAISQETSSIKGGIIGDWCGLDKTLLALSLVYI